MLWIGGLSGEEAMRLAAALPEWEEAILAGSDEILVPPDRAAPLLRDGMPLGVAGHAPAAAQSLPACYRSLDEIYLWAEAVARRNAWLVELEDIGDSYCKAAGGCRTPGGDRLAGRDLIVARVTNQQSEAPKDGRLFVDGGLHAREIPGPEVLTAFVEHLVAGYGVDPQVTYLLDHRELHAGLVSNPDGRALVELGTRRPYAGEPWSWRKNGHEDRRASCAWPPTGDDHYGVDLNRNHDFAWSAPGHGTDPCAVTFRGARPASEPEIQAYEAYARSLFPDRRGTGVDDPAPIDTSGMLVNLHNATLPGTVLAPWGWTEDPAPNADGLLAIADRYARLSGGYRVSQALYAVSGNTRDWAYGELGIPAYVVELQGRTFFTPCDELAELQRTQIPALMMALAVSDRPYERIRGPEVVEVTLPGRLTVGEALEVAAKVDAAAIDGPSVAAVEVTVARPGGGSAAEGVPVPGVLPGSGVPMEADDGMLDEPVERAVGTLDTGDWGTGLHYVVVRARGEDGSWGPSVASFVELVMPTVPPTPPATATPTPSATPSSTPSPTPSATPSSTPSPTPSATPTSPPTSTGTPTQDPSGTAVPSRWVWLPWAER